MARQGNHASSELSTMLTSTLPMTPVAADVRVRAAAGGDAIDAALAAALSLTVTYPNNCALGGDLIALVRRADGEIRVVNASGRALAVTGLQQVQLQDLDESVVHPQLVTLAQDGSLVAARDPRSEDPAWSSSAERPRHAPYLESVMPTGAWRGSTRLGGRSSRRTSR
jgi:hypothetical protein